MQRILSQHQLIRLLLIPYLIASLATCGGSGSNGDSIDETQNNTAGAASTTMSNMMEDADDLNDLLNSSASVSESTGNQFLSFFNDTLVPALEDSQADIDSLLDSEDELEAQVTANGGTVTLVSDDDLFEPQGLGLIAGAFILTAASLALLNAGLNTKARVKAVEDALDAARAAGASTAEAMSQNAALIKQKMNEQIVEIQTFIATNNKGVSFITDAAGRGGVAYGLLDAAGNALGIKKNAHLIGRKQGSSSSQLVQGQTAAIDNAVYIGTSNDNTFSNLQPGTWDFLIYVDGFVRGVAKNVVIAAGQTTNQTQTLNTLAETVGEDSDGDSGSSGNFDITVFQNTDGSTGTDGSQAEIQVSGSRSFPSISWTFANAIQITVSESNVSSNYGIQKMDDEEDNLNPFSSPVTYGDYSIADTLTLPGFANPSPALESGKSYVITIVTLDSTFASLAFTVN